MTWLPYRESEIDPLLTPWCPRCHYMLKPGEKHRRRAGRWGWLPQVRFIHSGGNENPYSATIPARLVWVHGWSWLHSPKDVAPCAANGCEREGRPVHVGFGPGTDYDSTSFVVDLYLCEGHAARAKQEGARPRSRSGAEVLLRRTVGLG